MTVQGLRRPWWWQGDFDTTGKTQTAWAVEAAVAYRAAHPEQYDAVTPPCDTPKCDTPVVTPSAARKRAWREANRDRSRELNRASKRRANADSVRT